MTNFENNMEKNFSTSKGVPSMDSLSLVDNESVSEIIKKRVEAINDENQESKEDDAFFVADIGDIKRQHEKWKSLLPRIEPFYDCASKYEIQKFWNLGVEPSHSVFAQTYKQTSFLRHARKHKVKLMTFDNEDELYKINREYPEAELLLGIHTEDVKAFLNFGIKFGPLPGSTKGLLQLAKSLDLNIIGVSFHVGSGLLESGAYRNALVNARTVFDQAREVGYNMSLLDVGGGFPASTEADITFDEIASQLSQLVDNMFSKDIRIIAEPGRFYSSSAFTLCTQIISRRVVTKEKDSDPKFMYYVNDGAFGSFRTLDIGYIHPVLKVLRKNRGIQQDWSEEKLYNSSIWGPTCSPHDVLTKETELPELDLGDWIIWEKMGSYASSAASEFNGILKAKIYYTETL